MASEIKEADSPASQLNRADLRPAPSAANSNKLYLFFWHAYSPFMYALYEIDVPRPLPPPPTAQDAEIKKPRPLFPILQLKTGEYPDCMSCVQLGSKLYFFGGEFNIDDPYIDEDVKKKLKNEKRDVFPRDVYIFDLDTHNISDKPLDKLLVHETLMNTGKASPYAFVANEKIYVVGSTIEMNISDRSKMKDLDLESFCYFEVYDPETKKWDLLPNPTIGDVETKWVGHAVVGSKALLVAWQLGKESLYCFDLCAKQWTKYAGLPSYPGNFSGRIEYVEDTLYGCYHSTIAAISPLAEEEEEVKEKEKEKEEKEEGEEEAEEFKHHRLHLVSEERGMNAIFNFPPQLDSSSSLLHLVNRHFCYVRTGMPLDPINGSDHAMDDTRRYISIVIFQALTETYKKDSTRLFPAKFLHSAHYVVDTPFSNEGFLHGCFSPGSFSLVEGATLGKMSGEAFKVFSYVMQYIHDPKDRDAVSLVCRKWYELEARTRKHVTIGMCYSTSPDRLRRRFGNLESLKLKGLPMEAMHCGWGGYATPWVREIAESFNFLDSLQFHRMIVKDSDLELLTRSRGRVLLTLKLNKCSGFTTHGLLHIGRSCRNLKTLFLEGSLIVEEDGKWLHELALNNKVLETLNFYHTNLVQVKFEDLELIARNCSSLVSVKISDLEILDLLGFFRTATALEEFCGGSSEEEPEDYTVVSLPPKLCCLGVNFMEKTNMSIVFPFAPQLKKLELLSAFLDTEDHCMLLQRCPNLEVLEISDIGDRGLEVLAHSCKRLKRLSIDETGIGEALVSQRGLIALAQGCLELEYLSLYVSDITNASLEHIGSYSKNLCDFYLVLPGMEERTTDFPLDNGVRALLRGCEKLRRFTLYVRPGGLSDVGLSYIGRYSQNVRCMRLGSVGESDAGLLEFSRGCPSLQKLEMGSCCFSERALAAAVMQLTSLRYLWVPRYRASTTGHDILAMARPFWNIELIPARRFILHELGVDEEVDDLVVDEEEVDDLVVDEEVDHTAHILAYYSLAGPRTDSGEYVIPLVPK